MTHNKTVFEQLADRMTPEALCKSFDSYLKQSASEEVKEIVEAAALVNLRTENLLFEALEVGPKMLKDLDEPRPKMSDHEAILLGLFVALCDDSDNLPSNMGLLVSFGNAEWQSTYLGRLYADGKDDKALGLIKEHHPNIDDAAHFIAMAAMRAATIIKSREAAKNPRANIKLTDIVKRLASEPGTAKELWPRLYGEMDSEGLEPEERNNGQKYRYTNEINGQETTISFKTFQNKLSQDRKKKSQ